jgi:hypothetical protein
MHLCQKVPFVLAFFKPRLRLGQKISDPDEKYALFGLDTQITINKYL